MTDITNEPVRQHPDATNTAPYPQFGENPAVVSAPLPVPGYPSTDAVPTATGNVLPAPGTQDFFNALMWQNQQLIDQVQEQARVNQQLLNKLNEANRNAAPALNTSAPQGGAPVLHHLHLVDGRVITDHEGIGTHYSETLDDGTSKVTAIKSYYPAEAPDPSTLFG